MFFVSENTKETPDKEFGATVFVTLAIKYQETREQTGGKDAGSERAKIAAEGGSLSNIALPYSTLLERVLGTVIFSSANHGLDEVGTDVIL